MKRSPAKAAPRTPRRVERQSVDVVRPAALGMPFVTFRYARMEIVAREGRAHVNATHTRFEKGTLTTERFAGEVDPAFHERLVASAQRLVLAQATSWLRAFSFFLPPPSGSRDRD